MQNKIKKTNQIIITSDLLHDKIQHYNTQIQSPKFTRKRNDIQTYLGKKNQIKSTDNNQSLIFISPKKYHQHHKQDNTSFTSKTSVKTVSPYDSLQNIPTNDESTISSGSVTSLIQPKITQSRTFQSAQQIIARVKSTKQSNQLKTKTQIFQKKINQLNQKIKNLKQQNQYLFNQIQGFKDMISQKNTIINQFSSMLKQKDHSITKYTNQLQSIKRKKSDLQSTILLLQNLVQQSSKCSCRTYNSESQTNQRSRQSWQVQSQRYKHQIQDLKSRLKYSQIQSNMYQKIRYDLQQQITKNQQLKTQNKKNLQKIQQLTQKIKQIKQIPKKIIDKRTPMLTKQKSRRDSEISLELSPEK